MYISDHVENKIHFVDMHYKQAENKRQDKNLIAE